MNILWDFRLFSFGYGSRGVGVFTQRMAEAILAEKFDACIYIWGDRKRVPPYFATLPVQWIDYRARTWKRDLVSIPLIIRRNSIDIFHYWIGLGPIHRMGMGLFHPCKTCVTVHDLGVEYWDESAYCIATRKTRYWKIQKLLFPMAHALVCNSAATLSDLEKVFKRIRRKSHILYPPLPHFEPSTTVKREKRFVLMDGGPNKNREIVMNAFQQFRGIHPEFSLAVFGHQDGNLGNEPGVTLESMECYSEMLAGSSGMLFCSLHEGLGLPALEAMSHACPLVLSDIPVLHETCADAGCFVDPRDGNSIVRGMEECVLQNEDWVQRSAQGAWRYRRMSEGVGKQWIEIYKGLV